MNLSVQESFPDDINQRRITATVQPSLLIKDNSGIFVAINDNYLLQDTTGVAAANLLTDKFEASLNRAEFVIDQIMQLKDLANA